MEMASKYFLSPIILLLLPTLFQLAIAVAPIAKPGCQDHCGNISTPYPFGTTKDCYLDESFEIVCDEAASPPRVFIRKTNMEVLNIGDGAAVVKGPIMSSNCSGRQSGPPANLEGSPFFFSFSNLFIAVGCNIRALLTEIGPQVSGCDSTCVPYYNHTTIIFGQEINSLCSGKHCCVARAPFRMQVFNPSLETKNESQDSSGCKLTFLADQEWVAFSDINNPQVFHDREYVPVVLAWVMDYKLWKYDPKTMSCKYFLLQHSLTLAYECSCRKGYEGNPYLGCVGKVTV